MPARFCAMVVAAYDSLAPSGRVAALAGCGKRIFRNLLPSSLSQKQRSKGKQPLFIHGAERSILIKAQLLFFPHLVRCRCRGVALCPPLRLPIRRLRPFRASEMELNENNGGDCASSGIRAKESQWHWNLREKSLL